MTKFKARPELRALPDPEAVAAFAAGAERRATTPVAGAEQRPAIVVAVVEEPARVAGPEPEPAIEPAAEAPTSARRSRRTVDDAPWEKLDRGARPLSGINVRLNDYEHELLKHLAAADARSLQQTIKRLLIPAAESAARKLRRGE